MCLNPKDPQSLRIFSMDGAYHSYIASSILHLKSYLWFAVILSQMTFFMQ